MKQKFWYFSVSNVKNIVFGISDANAYHETIAFFPSVKIKIKKMISLFHLSILPFKGFFNFDV